MIAYDPRRPEVVADPYPAFERLRDEEPAHWSEILGGWVLTRYADVRDALADPRLSADRITPFLARRTPTASEAVVTLLRRVGLWVVFTDPPIHTRLRGALGRVLTGRTIELRRQRIEAIEFTEPDRLDLRRAANRHLAFGYGIHFCLGASLARLEGQIALPALLARFPRLAARPEAPEWLDSLVFRGMRSLPVALG